jgi:3-oxoacyl-[acyl-carrier protein] reductase
VRPAPDLSSQVVLISGGTRGIGLATARLLAHHGASVCLGFCRDPRAAGAAVAEIQALGGRAEAFEADLSDDAAAQALVGSALDSFGRLDCAVVNHGIWQRAPLIEMSPEEWDRTLDVNLRGAWSLARHATRVMVRGGGGRIVFVSSTAGQRGEAEYAHYASSKGGLIALTRSLASELAPAGIRVNAVAPGWVTSDMTREALSGPGGAAALRSIPSGRFGTPEDVAAAVAFLASDLSSFVYGQVLPVNGGAVMTD